MTRVGLGVGVLVLAVTACGSVSSTANAGAAGASGTAGTGTAGTSGAAGSQAGGTAGSGGGQIGGAGSSGAAGASPDGGGAGTGAGASPSGFTLTKKDDPTVSTMPTLTWLPAAGATSYDVEVSTSATFDATSTLKMAGLVDTSIAWSTALTAGFIYYWRVTAVNGFGSTVASNAPLWMSSPASAGPSPHGVAASSGGKAVVANDAKPGTVTIVDLATFTTSAVSVNGQPAVVALTPDGAKAFVTEGSPNDVAIVDVAGKALAGAVTPPCVATTLYGLAVAANGSALVVPDFNGGCTSDVLDIVPLPGSTIMKQLPLGTSATAFGVAVTPDGASAIVTRGITATSIRRVDLAGGGVTTISGTSSTYGVAVTPDGKTAYVTSGDGDTIKPIALASNTVGAAIDFASNSEVCNIALAPDGAHAVVVGDFSTAVLDLATGTVATTYAIAGRCVAITPDGARALVTGAGATGKLYVVKLP
jgi:DNA-binding beta-propeller fold protein YncE